MPSERGADLGMRADAPPAVQQRGHRETPRRLRGEWQYSEGERSRIPAKFVFESVDISFSKTIIRLKVHILHFITFHSCYEFFIHHCCFARGRFLFY